MVAQYLKRYPQCFSESLSTAKVYTHDGNFQLIESHGLGDFAIGPSSLLNGNNRCEFSISWTTDWQAFCPWSHVGFSYYFGKEDQRVEHYHLVLDSNGQLQDSFRAQSYDRALFDALRVCKPDYLKTVRVIANPEEGTISFQIDGNTKIKTYHNIPDSIMRELIPWVSFKTQGQITLFP